MHTDIIILAAGKGKRMGGENLPKVLYPIKGVPMIQVLLNEVKKVNQSRPILVIGFRADMVKQFVGNGVEYALQEEQKGTAHAVDSARGKITSKNVAVLNGDMPFIKKESIQKLITHHEVNNSKVTMLTISLPNFTGVNEAFYNFGRIVRGEGNKIEKIVEFADATESEREIKEVNSGEYIFDTKWLYNVLPQIKDQNKQGEYYLTDVISLAVESGEVVQSLPINPTEMFGINTPEHLQRAQDIG